MNELKINDIKTLETIPDISLYIFILLIVLALITIAIGVFLLIKFLKNKKDDKHIYYEKLRNIDFSNSKDCAYKITKYGRLLISNDREIKLYEELINDLEKYKYKKNVKEIDSNTKRRFDTFMDSLDV